jgi:hypothetical protein
MAETAQIDPPDDATPTPDTYARVLTLVETLRHDKAQLQLKIARLQAECAPAEWLPLKTAAYEAGVPYWKAQEWAAAGWFESFKEGRVVANLTSLIACRVRLTGK